MAVDLKDIAETTSKNPVTGTLWILLIAISTLSTGLVYLYFDIKSMYDAQTERLKELEEELRSGRREFVDYLKQESKNKDVLIKTVDSINKTVIKPQ